VAWFIRNLSGPRLEVVRSRGVDGGCSVIMGYPYTFAVTYTTMRPCGACPTTVECAQLGEAAEVTFEPTEPGAIRCAGCGEIVCRDCARAHPRPDACAAEHRAWQHAQTEMKGAA
jgi:hypothetical protein